MKKTQSEELTIFHLDESEFEDAVKKNDCLMQTKTAYAAYVRNNTLTENALFAALTDGTKKISDDCRDEVPIVYISEKELGEKNREETVDFAGMLNLVSTSVAAFLFSRELIKRIGTFHTGLAAKTNFEFLCRAVREAGHCIVRRIVCDEETAGKEDRLIREENTAETLAYMIRYHMYCLHTMKAMDQVFTSFCEYAQSEGFFPSFQQKVNLFLSDGKAYEKLARQTAPFVILRGDDTCGGVLQGFAEDLADSLICKGQAVIMMDENFSDHEMLQNMVCKGIVGFQNKALEIDFFREIHGPKFQFWFDNPLRFEGVLRNLPEEYFILCQDANYASLIRKYYHTPNAMQFPPGGRMPGRMPAGQDAEQDSIQDNGQVSCATADRPYDIVFVGNYFEDEGERLTGFDREFYEYMLLHPLKTFEQGLEELRAELDRDDFVTLSCSLKPACRAVIGHFRNAVISTILDAGYALHVYGDSWKRYQGAGRENLTIHPYASVEQSLQELGKAKIGLNIMSWHKAGMTERIANIMLSGAVCLAEETTYLREHLREGEEIVTFCLDHLEELPIKIRELLDKRDLREKIAGNAYRRATEEYTWERRAEELISLAETGGTEQCESAESKRLVLFQGELDTLNLFSRQLRQGFMDLGYEIFDFDLENSARSLGLLHEFMQAGPVTAMIGFNSMFFGMTIPSGENMWEVLGIPCVNILVDHPYWYHNILMRMPATGIVLCIDRNHMDYVNRFYPNIPSNGFLAHGGASLRTSHKPVSERGIEVLYGGSLYAGCVRKPDFSVWDFPAEQICDRSIEYLLSHPTETIEHVIEKQLRLAGVSLPDGELRRFISSCVYIERIVSSRFRERIVSSVARAGISLELYGEGWENCGWTELPNVHYGGRITPEKILEKMEDSRIVLNTLPWFRDGSHERVFNAMLCGAAVVSETSRYLEEVLPTDVWAPFDLSDESLSALPRRIQELLLNENRLQEIASAGQELALSAHTWRARAQELHEDLLSFL